MSTASLGLKDIGIRKSKFVAKTQIRCFKISHFCAASTDDVPKEVYRSFLGGEIVTFMSHVLGRETCDISKYMEVSNN